MEIREIRDSRLLVSNETQHTVEVMLVKTLYTKDEIELEEFVASTKAEFGKMQSLYNAWIKSKEPKVKDKGKK